MAVLLLAEVVGGHLAGDSVAKALTAVAGLGAVDVLVAGPGASGAAETAAGLSGVARVLVAEDPGLARGGAEAMAALVVSLARDYGHVASASTAFSKSVLPRVAALLDVMVIPEVTAVIDSSTFERPVYAGNAVQVVRSRDSVKVFTVRTAGFAPAGTREGSAGGPAPVATVAVPPDPGLSSWVEDRVAASDRPDLTSAAVVVSGGRGVGSKESFALIEALADRLGAAVGASRAAVDSGYAPNDWQVGQTGKVVAPGLYVAVGISGAIQHLAGMKDSKVIVAINKDEEAPIFQVADLGLVGDLFQIVPELTGKL